ncbi:hypothetical protein Ngar_c21720 [Candidatus Nitrososphaera gargensis Ga9.2]|uniref:Uncharacterized protein n=1 Tax=Nitrososphaera gargensis (strain Ga9.2) TaxID=1237085 RepID=K0IKQ5_NITGG|nr:DUF6775 family putative metallopeptidase [Candidatus Nitrososphaera gargensis]AFU59102.1 hypothetical protein Ngar_c21720 [Candidatus Nitrososphaera gargensis Ga9.2]
MNFRFIHVYSDDVSIDAKAVAGEITKIFPSCKVDVRPAFKYDERRIELARIADIKQPFEKQPRQKTSDTAMMPPIYDGFALQRIFAETISAAEADHMHLIFTSLLACTFSEDDWRYHARTVICGSPSLISTAGIVEGPAKPREFYLAQLGGVAVDTNLKKRFAGRFIDYGDDKMMTAAAAIYTLQALFFFVTDGELFCKEKSCMLYNAHWQEELIYLIEKGALCAHHRQMASKFNKNNRSVKESF